MLANHSKTSTQFVFLKNQTPIMSLHGELRAVLFGEETEVVIDYLKDRGLPVAIGKTCQRCDTKMRFSVKATLSNKFVWRCKRKGCKTNVSVRDGSFFTKSKLPLNKLLSLNKLLHLFMVTREL